MKYLVTLRPLEPFLFGGENTYGKLGDEINGTYLVRSRQFPQQSAILGMLKKAIMVQSGVLTRKVRGEWVDMHAKQKAESYVGNNKFDMSESKRQNLGDISSVGPIFLIKNSNRFIKKVAIDTCHYEDGILKNYDPKSDIYDNFISLDDGQTLCSSKIFKEIEQTGNKIGGDKNSLFKKTSYLLLDGFQFAFYLESDYPLQEDIISLGADGSSFKMDVKEDVSTLDYCDKNGYLTLLSDTYIELPLKEHCEFAITSEISYQSLHNKKHATIHNEFVKSKKFYLYEKGSVIINPSQELIDHLNNENLQQIGYNIYTQKGMTI